MKKNKLSVHSENILPIIKKWLYSDKDIFLRELVSNACDALNKAKILLKEGVIAAEEPPFKISIRIDKAAKTLVIADTGIGMTEEEVEKYIAQIAFSGASEFVKKYGSQTEADPIIGHFGLGFYSAYMVASSVDIQTLSYQTDASPVFWTCDGSSQYEIGAGSKTTRGTEIILHIDEENADVLEESKVRELLNRYCRFLPFPIELNGESIGNQTPLWQKGQANADDQTCIEFYRGLYPLEPEPVFWIHLQIDYPFNLKGILYFPKMHRRFDANQSAIQLYCNRVFVSDNCKDILPDYLTILRGAIDCPDIPLNVSRSSLQVDKNVRQLSAHISKKISDRLTALYKTDRDKFIACWSDIEMVVKLGILQDDKFYEKIKDVLIWENSEGNFTTVTEYLDRNPGKVLYATQDRSGAILEAYKEKKAEFIYANAPIDIAVIQLLEEKLSTQFQRIDGAIDGALTDASREKTILDANGKSESTRMADSFKQALSQDGIAIEAKSLSSDQLPGFIVLDENERRFRDYMMLTQGKAASHLLSKKTLVINTNSRLIQTIVKLQGSKPELATDLAKHVLDLSLLAQKELDPAEAPRVIARQSAVLEKLAGLVSTVN